MAKEGINLNIYWRIIPQGETHKVKCYKCPKGNNKSFPENIIKLDPSKFGKIEQFEKLEDDICPLIIKIVTL